MLPLTVHHELQHVALRQARWHRNVVAFSRAGALAPLFDPKRLGGSLRLWLWWLAGCGGLPPLMATVCRRPKGVVVVS